MPESGELMKLYLQSFTVTEVLGIYGADKTTLPERMRYLHPDAAASFVTMNAEKQIRCSDMFRTPEGSLVAMQKAGGVGLRPGWSGHNYGFSIDIDVTWVMRTHGFKDKRALDAWMVGHGWYCHNVPGYTGSRESWHFNFFGEDAPRYLSARADGRPATWSKPLEMKVQEYYGDWWKEADLQTVQRGLRKLGLYNGALDGESGPQTTEAVKAFQRAWMLSADGVAGPNTKRTLMLVSAEKVVSNAPC